MDESAAVVRHFLRLLESGDSEGAVALIADGIEWRNTGMPTVRGRRVAAILRDMERRGIGFEARLHHLATHGSVVLTERTDVLRYGRWRAAFWVCGTFKVEDGQITLWDDHFSPGGFLLASIKGLRGLLNRR